MKEQQTKNIHDFLDESRTLPRQIASISAKHIRVATTLWVWVILYNVTFFSQNFSYIMTVSFIGGGNQSTWRKPLTCRKSLTNFTT